MFSSCLSDVQQLVGKVILECAPRLATLFARSFPFLTVHGIERTASSEWLSSYSRISAKTAIGSLPRWLRRSPQSFPNHKGYLRADPDRIASYRRKLAALGTKTSIGLSWRAGTPKTRGALRSIPFQEIAQLIVPNARFVCLQHGLNDQERQAARDAGLIMFEDSIGDVDNVAALIAAVDLVITADNTNAHLCGALGTRGWVLLNESPEWRWGYYSDRSLWYPSLTLLRRKQGHAWRDLVSAVHAKLAKA